MMIILDEDDDDDGSMSNDDDEEEEDNNTWWGWLRLVNIFKMSRELPSTYPLFHLIIYLFSHLSIDHHTHPPHPLIHLRRLDYYDDGISKTLLSVLIKCIKPTHLLCFHLRRLDYCVHASGGGGKGGGKVDQANGSFPVTPSLTIDVLLGYAHEYLKETLK
jgi:hypothetical protein